MTRLRGWASKGERLVDKVPHGHWKTATFLAALRNDRIEALCLFDGPINGERFHAYVEQFLAPTLKPGDVVTSTISARTRQGPCDGRSATPGWVWCFCRNTPPTSIRSSRSSPSSKTRLRKAEARSYEAVSQACAQILTQYPPEECAAYIRNAGYA